MCADGSPTSLCADAGHDTEHHVAWLDGKNLNLNLTRIEVRLLSLLLSMPGRIDPRDHLQRRLYDASRIVADPTIDSHVRNLRRKLQTACPTHNFIRPIYGVGYPFEFEGKPASCLETCRFRS
ncbi:winged helix-turn-helix domain-containing protein [Burkholderia sp. BCC1977]|uniref:winged helix-turn-helix domain-containing protein n=1 Tax=Burkholderia sp. BCC1977 TaxID=2817440 RepID=UPI002ABE2708|nr:winged helix-turn-helix domain-containing protein [Burkholderia sp. BCC1977]